MVLNFPKLTNKLPFDLDNNGKKKLANKTQFTPIYMIVNKSL